MNARDAVWNRLPMMRLPIAIIGSPVMRILQMEIWNSVRGAEVSCVGMESRRFAIIALKT